MLFSLHLGVNAMHSPVQPNKEIFYKDLKGFKSFLNFDRYSFKENLEKVDNIF